MTEEKVISNEEFFNNFIAENQSDLNRDIAKQQDIIDMLSAKVDDIRAAQNKQTNTVAACKAVIDSNAYQKLNPIISSFSDVLSKSAAKKDKKITDIEKKIKRIKKKIKKLERKRERTNQLKGFIDTLRNPSAGQSEFIEGMKALRQDSIFRTENQIDKIDGRISKAVAKLESGNLSNVDTVKLKAKVKKLESKRDKLVAKINNLNELDQELNKLAKIELVDDKVDEMKNTAVETAETAAMEGESVENIIDTEAEAAADNIDRIISDTFSLKADTAAKPDETNIDDKKSDVKEETEKSAKKQTKDDEVIAKLNAQIDYDLAVYNDITRETSEMIKDSGYMLQNGHLTKTENHKQNEKTDNKNNQCKLKNVTETEMGRLANAGIDFSVVHSDGVCYATFDKSQLANVQAAIGTPKNKNVRR